MKKYCKREVMAILDKFPMVKNAQRKNFVLMFILSMIKVRSVQFKEIAEELNPDVKTASSEVRIQDFFREVELNYDQIALLLAFFLPRSGKITLCMDRTEWDFGKFQCNILMIVARCQNSCIPLYWELLDNKSGNSNTEDRINLLKKCITLLGSQRIGLFLADREFIGHKWLSYLKSEGITFCVRVPKHHKITRQDGERCEIETLLPEVKKSKVIKITGCMVDGVWGNVYAKKDKEDDILFLFGTATTEHLGALYRKRWTIEAFFQNVKKRGFNLGETHLRKRCKLKKMVAMVSLAYAFTLNMGLHHHNRVKKIPLKKHGYKANSFSRKGIDLIRSAIKREWDKNIDKFIAFIQKFIRWIKINPNGLSIPDF